MLRNDTRVDVLAIPREGLQFPSRRNTMKSRLRSGKVLFEDEPTDVTHVIHRCMVAHVVVPEIRNTCLPGQSQFKVTNQFVIYERLSDLRPPFCDHDRPRVMVVDHKVNAMEVHCLKQVVLSPCDEAYLMAAAAVELTLAAAHTPEVDTPLLGRKVRARPKFLMVSTVPMIYGDAVAVAASWLRRLLLFDGNVGE